MSEPFLAEIKIVGFTFAPRGWALCDGQILPINQYQSLYSLLGTTFGGDGRTSFGLPELRGRVPIHEGGGHALGQKSGVETVTLGLGEIPNHTHQLKASSAVADSSNPAGRVFAAAGVPIYHGAASLVNVKTPNPANAGGGQGHNNMMPFLTLNFCIALQGLFPSRN